MRSARLPWASMLTPMIRPGIDRLNSSLCRKKSGVRTTKTHRYAKTLGRAHGHIGTQFTGWGQQGQGQQIGGHHDIGAGSMNLLDESRGNRARPRRCRDIERWRRNKKQSSLALWKSPVTSLDADRLRPGEQHIFGLRKDIAVDKKFWSGNMVMVFVFQIEEHGHRFCGGRAFIQQGGIGQRKTREVGYHRLEIQQAFESALRNLRLVGGILGIPARIFENISEDNAGYDGIVITLADIGFENLVYGSDLREAR